MWHLRDKYKAICQIHCSKPFRTFDVHHPQGQKQILAQTKDTNSRPLVIPTIYFGQILSTEVRSYIISAKQKEAREHKNVGLGGGLLFVPSFENCIVAVERFCWLEWPTSSFRVPALETLPPDEEREGKRKRGRKETGMKEGRDEWRDQVLGVVFFLHGEQDEESHHQTEETHGLRQSEPQDGVGEQLLLQGRVPAEEGDTESDMQ